MRGGFVRALMPYSHVDGRITELTPGDLALDCIGEG
jgi:hypothetical protein